MKHMLVDTSPEKDELGKPAMEIKQPEEEVKKPLAELVSKLGMKTFEPEKFISKFDRNVKFWFLSTFFALLAVASYYLLKTGYISSIFKQLPTDKVVLTAILYSDEKPSAVISGNVVFEGDVVSGYTVVKIQKDIVELEKNGKRITKQVYKKQSPVGDKITIR